MITVSLPCLSVHQPWAWAIGEGLKHFENRSWSTDYRGAVLIHASKACNRREYEESREFIEALIPHGSSFGVPPLDALSRGGLVAAGKLIEVYSADGPSVSRWHMEGLYGWQLAPTIRLPFRAVRGNQGLFYVKVTRREHKALLEGGVL